MDMPEELSQIHIIFHVSQLQKCMTDDSVVVPLDDIQFDEFLNYVERPVAIQDRNTMALRNKVIPLVNVQWQHKKGSKWTQEPEAEINEHCQDLFVSEDFEDGIQFQVGGGIITPDM